MTRNEVVGQMGLLAGEVVDNIAHAGREGMARIQQELERRRPELVAIQHGVRQVGEFAGRAFAAGQAEPGSGTKRSRASA